jgi:hypothetical protein
VNETSRNNLTTKSDRRLARLLAPLPIALLLAVGVLGATSASADDIYPPDMAAISPCLNSITSTVPVRVCFHTPGDSVPVAGFASGTHTGSVELWKYTVPTPLTGFDGAGDLIIPCAIARYTNPGSSPVEAAPCDAIGDRYVKDAGYTLYLYTYDPPQVGIMGYLVEMKLDVTVGGYGIVNQDTLLFCKDPYCERL